MLGGEKVKGFNGLASHAYQKQGAPFSRKNCNCEMHVVRFGGIDNVCLENFLRLFDASLEVAL